MLTRRKDQITEISKIEVEIKDIQGCFPAQIMARGNSYYVRLDPSSIRFWELQPEDEILVTVTKAKRESEHQEQPNNIYKIRNGSLLRKSWGLCVV